MQELKQTKPNLEGLQARKIRKVFNGYTFIHGGYVVCAFQKKKTLNMYWLQSSKQILSTFFR